MAKAKPKLLSEKGNNARKIRAHAFKPGDPKPKTGGRAKGTRNRTTRVLKDAILTAASLVGADGKGKDGLVGYLMMLARKEKQVYARLLEKVIPLQIGVKDETPPQYTAEEMVKRLQERRLPVPTGLLQIASSVVIAASMEEEYADELNGVGYEGEGDNIDDDEETDE